MQNISLNTINEFREIFRKTEVDVSRNFLRTRPEVFADRPAKVLHGILDRRRDRRARRLRVQVLPSPAVQTFAVNAVHDVPDPIRADRLAEPRPEPESHQRLQRLVRVPAAARGRKTGFRRRIFRRGHFDDASRTERVCDRTVFFRFYFVRVS